LGRSLKLRPGGIVGLIIGCAKEEFVQLVNSGKIGIGVGPEY